MTKPESFQLMTTTSPVYQGGKRTLAFGDAAGSPDPGQGTDAGPGPGTGPGPGSESHTQRVLAQVTQELVAQAPVSLPCLGLALVCHLQHGAVSRTLEAQPTQKPQDDRLSFPF